MNEVAVASPRISTGVVLVSLIERKASVSPLRIWKENRPGDSVEGTGTKDSNADTAEDEALKIPYLSQLKYLFVPLNEC